MLRLHATGTFHTTVIRSNTLNVGMMRLWLQGAPEEHQKIKLPSGNHRPYLLITTHRSAE